MSVTREAQAIVKDIKGEFGIDVLDLIRRSSRWALNDEYRNVDESKEQLASEILKVIDGVTPAQLEGLRSIAMEYSAGDPHGTKSLLAFDVLSTTLVRVAIDKMNLNDKHFEVLTAKKELAILRKSAAFLGCSSSKFILAALHFNNLNNKEALKSVGLESATAYQYMCQAAEAEDAEDDVHAYVAHWYLHDPKYPALEHGLPFDPQKATNHFIKAVERNTAHDVKRLLIHERKYGRHLRHLSCCTVEDVLFKLCLIALAYLGEYHPPLEHLKDLFKEYGIPVNGKCGGKRALVIMKFAASKGYIPAINGLGGKTPNCASCGKSNPKMQHCTACMCTRYCSKKCQANDWTRHKKVCKNPQQGVGGLWHNMFVNPVHIADLCPQFADLFDTREDLFSKPTTGAAVVAAFQGVRAAASSGLLNRLNSAVSQGQGYSFEDSMKRS